MSNKVIKVLSFFREYAQDLWIFLRYNNHSPLEPKEKRLANKTIIDAHTIEKGLTLPEPKPHFGQSRIENLLNMNAHWSPQDSELSRSMLVGALDEYQKSFAGIAPPDVALAARIKGFVAAHERKRSSGGVRHLRVHSVENPAAVRFLSGRYAAREFGKRPLNSEELEEVAILAQRAPSQCNRQSSRLHVYRNPSKIKELLTLQKGARGFAEMVPTLFVVTSEITAWGGPQQRNQPYVDGGLYAMMLMLALDAKGFLSCPLNLAITNRTEHAIKRAANIPPRERLIVMVAAGTAPDYPIRAANSPRWDLDSVCQVHD